MARGKTRKKPKAMEPVIEPTPEQLSASAFERAGLAYRRIPVIDMMVAAGTISRRQYNGLRRYRDVAVAEDASPLRDSLDKAQDVGRASGVGLPPSILRASIETGRLERALGTLRAIARAVAVDDLSVSQWAMQQSGSSMRSKAVGRRTVSWFEPRRKALEVAMLEIKMAGERLAAEIGA